MNPKNIIILTGNDTRHKFFIHHLNANFSISEAYVEIGHYPRPSPQSKEESIAWDWFFQRRECYEKKLVRKSGRLIVKNKPKVTYLDNDELNSPHTIAKIKKVNPGFIAVFGTCILRKALLKRNFQTAYLICTFVTRNFIGDRLAISGLFIRENFIIRQQPYIELIKILIPVIFCPSRLSY